MPLSVTRTLARTRDDGQVNLRPRLIATDLDGTIVRARRFGVRRAFSRRSPPRWTSVSESSSSPVGRPAGCTRWPTQPVTHGVGICANGAFVYDMQTRRVLELFGMSGEVAADAVGRVRDGAAELGVRRGVAGRVRLRSRLTSRAGTSTSRLWTSARSRSCSTDDDRQAARAVTRSCPATPCSSSPPLSLRRGRGDALRRQRLAARAERPRCHEGDDAGAAGARWGYRAGARWSPSATCRTTSRCCAGPGAGYAVGNAHPWSWQLPTSTRRRSTDDGVAQVLERAARALVGLDAQGLDLEAGGGSWRRGRSRSAR